MLGRRKPDPRRVFPAIPWESTGRLNRKRAKEGKAAGLSAAAKTRAITGVLRALFLPLFCLEERSRGASSACLPPWDKACPLGRRKPRYPPGMPEPTPGTSPSPGVTRHLGWINSRRTPGVNSAGRANRADCPSFVCFKEITKSWVSAREQRKTPHRCRPAKALVSLTFPEGVL